ncbi:MAG: hypothetical protein EOO11_10990 [Chitinophagaceae bacterium]|nr:MAG: hypothetical protein EOO11_10990 [Chitinophagaceae bacterium]
MKKRTPAFLALCLLALLTACQQEIQGPPQTGQPQQPPAAFSLQDTAGNCLPDSVHGSYRAGRALGDSNFIEVTVRVTTPGSITLSIAPQNGISFTGTVQAPAAGLATVRLAGSGTPLAAGSTALVLAQGGTSCPLALTVDAAAPGGGTPAGSACFATVSGVFKKDSALGPIHQISLIHAYASSGSFTVSTDTVNGYYFRKDVTAAYAGANVPIMLQGFGTPGQLGSDTFTVRFGDGERCGFRISVVAGTPPAGGSTADTTMFPLAVGNWWSYAHPSLSGMPGLIDSVKITVIGTKLIDGKTYFQCYRRSGITGSQSPFGTMDDTLYFRKEANGAVYQNFNLNAEYGWYNNYTFSNPARGEVLLYEPGRAVGDSWYSDVVPVSTSAGPLQFRVRSEVMRTNWSFTMTVNNFTGIYQVSLEPEVNDGTGWYPMTGYVNRRTKAFVRGVGMVAEEYEVQYSPIRYWHLQ